MVGEGAEAGRMLRRASRTAKLEIEEIQGSVRASTQRLPESPRIGDPKIGPAARFEKILVSSHQYVRHAFESSGHDPSIVGVALGPRRRIGGSEYLPVLANERDDCPVQGRVLFEEVVRENLDLGRPDQVQLIFNRRVTKRTPSRYRTRVITMLRSRAGRQPDARPRQKGE